MFQAVREAELLFGEILLKNESIIWAGRPKQGFALKSSDKYLIPFSIFWCGFIFIWEYITLYVLEGATILSFFGIPFILIGLYLLIGRYFMDASIRKNTYYALSDNRVFIRTGVWNISTNIYRFKDLSQIQFTEKADGSGNILIRPVGITFPQEGKLNRSALPQGAIQFELIDSVKKVFLLLQEKIEREASTK